MPATEIETYCPSSKSAWRSWLKKHHRTKQSVWLIYYKKQSKNASISWSEAVDEALCFGWIDSIKKKVDDERFMQLFSKRKPTSTWSKINKAKVKQLTAQGLMDKAGLECVAIAQQNGSWTILDEVEELILPPDLEKALEKNVVAKDSFLRLSPSMRKSLLLRLVLVKTQETRDRHIAKIMAIATEK